MKRLFSLLSAALFVVAALSPASARGAKTWEETKEYGPPEWVGVVIPVGVAVGGVSFESGRARTVEVAVEDTAAPATAIRISQGDQSIGVYCTSTPKPIDIASHQTLRVTLLAGVCGGGPSFITTGQVRARFST